MIWNLLLLYLLLERGKILENAQKIITSAIQHDVFVKHTSFKPVGLRLYV